ncbi:hypothetical protein BBP40_001958 [Aspergillus hancockii]|nr:hypothetical protein BBP40_001958 [Aspergillus hancockii]
MRIQAMLISPLVTGALSQSPAKQYEDLCHTKDGTTEEIPPGYKVVYKCGQVGSHNGEPVTDIMTSKACAELCEATHGCTRSSWAVTQTSYVLSDSRKGTAREDTLHMERVVESNRFDAEDPFGKGSAEGRSCEGLIEASTSKLKECMFDGMNGLWYNGSVTHNTKRRLGKCNDESVLSARSASGHSFKVYCQKLDDVGWRDLKFAFIVNFVKDCTDACASYKDNGCKRANLYDHSRRKWSGFLLAQGMEWCCKGSF